MKFKRFFSATLLTATVLISPVLFAVEPPRTPGKSAATDVQPVELFQALKEGQLDIRFIPQNSKQGKILLENKTKQPLSVRLPEALAGIPVLAQFGQNVNVGNQGVGGGGQAVGVPGGGVFNVPPEKVRPVKVQCVCLEHGKPDPNARMEYKLVPIEEFGPQPGVVDLIKAFGSGKLDQSAVQAAAWHLNNGISWPELAAKTTGRKGWFGATESYFTPQQLHWGMRFAQGALQAAQQNPQAAPQPPSLGKGY